MLERIRQAILRNIVSPAGHKLFVYFVKKETTDEGILRWFEVACSNQSPFCLDYMLQNYGHRIPLVNKAANCLGMANLQNLELTKRILADCEADIRQSPEVVAIIENNTCNFFAGLLYISIALKEENFLEFALTKVNDAVLSTADILLLLQAIGRYSSSRVLEVLRQKYCAIFNNPQMVNRIFKIAANTGSELLLDLLLLDYKHLIEPSQVETSLVIAAKNGEESTFEKIVCRFKDNVSNQTLISAYLSAATLPLLMQLEAQVGDFITEENRYTACLNAAKNGSLTALNYHLAFPSALQKLTRRNNEIVRTARSKGHSAIVERLNEFEEVRNFQSSEPTVELDRVLNPENAIIPLTNDEKEILLNFRTQYQSKFTDPAAILTDLCKFLIKLYFENPIQKPILPFMVEETLQEYYKNEPTTVYRYLFSKNNPLIHPKAEYATVTATGMRATITDEEYLIIACIWVAICDEETPLPIGFTREQIKRTFVNTLALMARSHNWDKTDRHNDAGEVVEYDDMEGDKPICPIGIPQQLIGFIKLLKRDQSSQERPLDKNVIMESFYSHVVCGTTAIPGVFAALEDLNIIKLEMLLESITKKYSLNIHDDETENAKTEDDDLTIFHPSYEGIRGFIQFCNEHYGADRMAAEQSPPLTWRASRFSTYLKFIDYLAENVLENFAALIINKIRTLISQKKSSQLLTFQAPSEERKKRKRGTEAEKTPRDEGEERNLNTIGQAEECEDKPLKKKNKSMSTSL